MHKIDSDGATVDNKFTEGNAALSIPATVVSGAIANAWQEELVNVIEGVGITLLTSGTDTFDQLQAAIIKYIQQGGQAAPITFALANNTAATDVVGFPDLDELEFTSLECFFSIERQTDTNGAIESGRLYATYSDKTSSWTVDIRSSHGDAGSTFSEAAGKLQVATDDMTGASYVGVLKITDIKKITV